MYDDFSLPYMHQKPIFSPLSCSLQTPERISGEKILKFFTQRVVFALCGPHGIILTPFADKCLGWRTSESCPLGSA